MPALSTDEFENISCFSPSKLPSILMFNFFLSIFGQWDILQIDSLIVTLFCHTNNCLCFLFTTPLVISDCFCSICQDKLFQGHLVHFLSLIRNYIFFTWSLFLWTGKGISRPQFGHSRGSLLLGLSLFLGLYQWRNWSTEFLPNLVILRLYFSHANNLSSQGHRGWQN